MSVNEDLLAIAEQAARQATTDATRARIIALNVVADYRQKMAEQYKQQAQHCDRSIDHMRINEKALKERTLSHLLREQAKLLEENHDAQ